MPDDAHDVQGSERGPIVTELYPAEESVTPSPADAPSHGLITRKASDICPRPIDWLWPSRIALGKVSLIAGDPGLGKSQSTLSIAAIVSVGGSWPDGGESPRGTVLICSAEDDPEDTVVPRLQAAGADLGRVQFVEGVDCSSKNLTTSRRAFNLEVDLPRLTDLLERTTDVKLIIIDPIAAYLGSTDSHKNAEVRGLMAALKDLAEQFGVAIVCVSHLSKDRRNKAVLTIQGSIGFVAGARSAWFVGKDPDDPDRRLFLPVKNNVADDKSGLAFHIEPVVVYSEFGPIETSRVDWHPGPVTVTVDDLQSPTGKDSSGGGGAVAEAEDFLRELLGEGPLAANAINVEARKAGISSASVQRAKSKLGIKPRKTGMGGSWVWELTKVCSKESEDAHTQSLSTLSIFEKVEHLRDDEVEVEL